MARGLALEPRLLKVLKGVAELYDVTPGKLLNELVRAALAGQQFFPKDRLVVIARLKTIYGIAEASRSTESVSDIEGPKGNQAKVRA